MVSVCFLFCYCQSFVCLPMRPVCLDFSPYLLLFPEFYIFWMLTHFHIYSLEIPFAIAYLLTLLTEHFAVQKLFSLMKFLLFCFCYPLLQGLIRKLLFQLKYSEVLSLCCLRIVQTIQLLNLSLLSILVDLNVIRSSNPLIACMYIKNTIFFPFISLVLLSAIACRCVGVRELVEVASGLQKTCILSQQGSLAITCAWTISISQCHCCSLLPFISLPLRTLSLWWNPCSHKDPSCYFQKAPHSSIQTWLSSEVTGAYHMTQA